MSLQNQVEKRAVWKLGRALAGIGFALPAALMALLAAGHGAVAQAPSHGWVIEVHAGAGNDIQHGAFDAAGEAARRAALQRAIAAGAKVLEQGGTSLDAVEAAIRVLENLDLFDAGLGAVLNAEGQSELDAAIMDGATLRVGSVAGVHHAQHPISLARAVMEKTPHVLLVGAGADQFLHQSGGEEVASSFFFSEAKWQALTTQLKEEHRAIPPRPQGAPAAPQPAPQAVLSAPHNDGRHYGTVGVVALDRAGNLAAGTSTGGSRGKLPGRVGDSPIIGAGTYASNDSCAVSATGVGEYFIRLTVAREVCSLVQYKGMPLQQAADEVIHKRLQRLNGEGAVIALTRDGQAVWSFNTSGMFRARLREGGKVELGIFADEQ